MTSRENFYSDELKHIENLLQASTFELIQEHWVSKQAIVQDELKNALQNIKIEIGENDIISVGSRSSRIGIHCSFADYLKSLHIHLLVEGAEIAPQESATHTKYSFLEGAKFEQRGLYWVSVNRQPIKAVTAELARFDIVADDEQVRIASPRNGTIGVHISLFDKLEAAGVDVKRNITEHLAQR